MSYRAGVYGQLAAMMNIEPGGPWVKCDGCGLKLTALTKKNGMPKVWLLDGKSPPGWKTIKHDDGTRDDRCPLCKKAPTP